MQDLRDMTRCIGDFLQQVFSYVNIKEVTCKDNVKNPGEWGGGGRDFEASDGSKTQREGEWGRREVATKTEGDGESDKEGGMGQHVRKLERERD